MSVWDFLLGNHNTTGISAGAGGLSAILGLGAAFTDDSKHASASGAMKMASGASGILGGATGLGSSVMDILQNGTSGKKGASGILGALGGLLGMGGGIANMISGNERRKGKKGNQVKEANAGIAGGLLSALGGSAGIA